MNKEEKENSKRALINGVKETMKMNNYMDRMKFQSLINVSNDLKAYILSLEARIKQLEDIINRWDK